MGFLSGLLGLDAGKATSSAAKQNITQLQDFRDLGNTIINDGQNQTQGVLDKAAAAYDPWVKSGTAANTMYGNALGLNGADGNTAATDAFQTNPGYDFALKQGEQSALRAASAGGMLNSGNTLAALQEYGQGTANKEYGSWLDRLMGVSNKGLEATGGQTAQYDKLANVYQNSIDRRLDLESGYTQGVMGARNQNAQGKEAGSAATGGLLKNLVGLGSGIKGLF